jgi:hypothetical protein
LHLPLSGSAIPDPTALKQGFIDMCKAYNDKQLAVINECLTKPAGTSVTIRGTDDTDIPPNYKTMMQDVAAFATKILTKLLAVASTEMSVPEFKKLCVSSYLVNLVTKTSTKFKINQYTSLLKSNRAFAAILGGLKSEDPLVTMVAGGASSRKRSRKIRRSRRRTSTQRGGSYEFAATRAGFLQGTANFYNSLDRFGWNDDTRWDFLNFCYPYLEYVGDCGSTHPQLLDYLKKGYDAQNGLVSNASSSSAASAGGGEPFSDDLSDFDDWYHGKVNELRQIQLEFAESPTHTMGHNAEHVNIEEFNILDEVQANPSVAPEDATAVAPAVKPTVAPTEEGVEEANVIGVDNGDDQEGSLQHAATPVDSDINYNERTEQFITPNAPFRRGRGRARGGAAGSERGGGGGGSGGTIYPRATLSLQNSPVYALQSEADMSMSSSQIATSAAASQMGNTPLSQGLRSPTLSVVSAAEGGRQMKRLPMGGSGDPPSSSAAAGEASSGGGGATTYFGAGNKAQFELYAVKPTLGGGVEFRRQNPPIQAAVAAGGGGASSSSSSSASAVEAKLQASAQALYAGGGGAPPSSSSAAVAEAAGENIATSPSKKRRTEGEQESFPTNGTTGKRRRKTRKTRRARRSTTRRNRR